MEKLLKTTAIQDELILNFENYQITAQEFVIICQMLTIDPVSIDLISFLRITKEAKPIISSLVTKKIIRLCEIEGKMLIDLLPLYELLNDKKSDYVEMSLTSEQVDKIVHIFSRNLFPNEIHQINSWIAKGITYPKIEEAIYVALAKGINNLNYIEKIVFNSKEEAQDLKKEGSIKRNWTY